MRKDKKIVYNNTTRAEHIDVIAFCSNDEKQQLKRKI